MHKPDGHPSVSPYLVVADAEAALAFIAAVFDAEPSLVLTDANGRIRHAEIPIADSLVMLGQMEDGPQAHLHVYVRDVDAVLDRAVQAGGTLVQAAIERGDGDRRGGVRDPAGTTWWLATHIDPSERDRMVGRF